jgi:S-adenosylmethionine uptake transporter
MPSLLQSLWMIVASFLFAGMGVCVKLAAEAGFAAAEIVFYRCAIALVLMTGAVLLRGVRLATPHWGFQLNRAISGFLALSLYFWAITLLPLATAVTLNYTAPLFLALLLVCTGLRLSWGMGLSLAMGFFGVALLLKPSFSAEQWFGGLIGLSSGVLAALAYYNVRELGELGEPETRTVFYFSLFSTLGSLVWLAFSPLHPVRGRGALALLGVGVLATLAQLAMTRAYARGKPLVSASLAYTTVVFSSLFGAVFWGDRLEVSALSGMLLVGLSGMAASCFSRAPRPGRT